MCDKQFANIESFQKIGSFLVSRVELEHCDFPKVTKCDLYELGYELQYTYMHMLTHLVQFKSNVIRIMKSLDKGVPVWILSEH